MKRLTRQLSVLIWGIILVSVPAPAAAQNDGPQVEISAGWRLLKPSGELVYQWEELFPLGWYADVAIPLTDTISVVGDVSGAYRHIDETPPRAEHKIDFRLYTFLGGVRFSNRSNARIVPFGQVLIGVIRGSIEGTSTFTNVDGSFVSVLDRSQEAPGTFAIDLGGGVTFKISDAVGLRIGGSYLKPTEKPFRPISPDVGASGVRFGAGVVVFPF